MARTKRRKALYQNSQWAVTKFGLETVWPEARYEIEASRLTTKTERWDQPVYDWPVHLAEKEWVDLTAFSEAFVEALSLHQGSYFSEVDEQMLAASFTAARRIRRSLEGVPRRRTHRKLPLALPQGFRHEIMYTSHSSKCETIHTPGGGKIVRCGRFTIYDCISLEYVHLVRPYLDNEGRN